MAKLLWNILAKSYDRRFNDLYQPIFPLLEKNLKQSDSTIELGCGSGLISFFVIPKVKKFTGVDISPQMISQCKKKLEQLPQKDANTANFLIIDAQNSLRELNLGTFDKILIINVLHVVDSPAKLIREAKSLLSPGGTLLIGDFCHAEPINKKYRRMSNFMGLASKLKLMDKLTRFSFEDLIDLIRGESLSIRNQQTSTEKFPFLWIECN